jgi:dolichol-phosphate mannosyltransferase
MAKTNNPLFYFGSVGTLSTLAGIGLAAYVAYEWFVRSISHEVIAFLAGSAVLFGVQLLMFAVLSDMIVAVNREQTHQIQQIARKIGDEEGVVDAGPVGEDAAGQSADVEEAADVEESTVDESGVDPAES